MMTRRLIPTNPDLVGMVTMEGMGKGGQLRMETTTNRAAIMLTVGNVTMSNPRGTQALAILASLHMDGVPTRDLVARRSVEIHL